MAVEPMNGIRRIRPIRIWVVAIALALVSVAMAGCVVIVPVPVPVPGGLPLSPFVETWDAGGDAVREGPLLTTVASLPVDASGEGTIQGAPTGEAECDDTAGTFKLVLVPAPAGLPARTTLHVGFDHSTKVYRGGQSLGDPVAAMMGEGGPDDADPSAAGTVLVRFHIKDGRAVADRLDLSDEYPSGIDP